MHPERKYPVKCGGHGQDESGDWYVEIVFKGPPDRRSKVFAMAELALDQKPIWAFLGAAGYIPSGNERKGLWSVLQTSPTKASFEVFAQQGWHGRAFVTPFRTYGRLAKHTRKIQSDTVDSDKWTPRGKLKTWQQGISDICNGNPMLAFAVILAFVPPLLRIMRLPTVGFSLVGDSGLGKSTALALAGQPWGGNPDRKLGFCETLLKTPNAYDKVGRRYRDCFLGLDETHLVPAQALKEIIYRLSASDSKETAIDGSLPTHGVLLYLMISNLRLEDKLLKERVQFDESLTARLIEIGIEKPNGVIDFVPDGEIHAFVEKINRLVANVYGCPIDGYLEKLALELRKDKKALKSWLRKRMTSMRRRLRIDGNTSGEERRGQYFWLPRCSAWVGS